MSEENQYKQANDHDLLIRLDTKFEQILSKVENILSVLHKKANKEDLDNVREHVVLVDKRVSTIEENHRDEMVRRTAFLKIGKWSITGWQIIFGIVISGLTIINLLSI